MCGIVGYVGEKQATGVLLEGLTRLEYRGYDSAGLAVLGAGASMTLVRRKGKLSSLKEAVGAAPVAGGTGIGHTRWATHGKPSEQNAHPHADCAGEIAVVHNGIIENYVELRDELLAAGHRFDSETDTEIVAHLIESYYQGDLARAVRRAARRLNGSYALGVVHKAEPGVLVAARKDSPLVIGLGEGENLLASDIPAVLKHTREILVMQDGDVALVTADSVELTDLDGGPIDRAPMHVDWDLDAAEKGGYEDFMLKEIFEQPAGVRETLRGRVVDGRVLLSELEMAPEEVAAIDRVYVVACGTSYHSGLVSKRLIEEWARIPVEVVTSSEFRYADQVIDDKTLTVAITQSGETTDTIAAVRHAVAGGSKVVAVTNVVGSSVTREAHGIIQTNAGPEIGVAATKTFTAQIAALYVLAMYLGQVRGTMSAGTVADVWERLSSVPEMIQRVLDRAEDIKDAVRHFDGETCSTLFLGRQLGVPVAMEGALKLKEISYIHAEAYPAGEMKHGPIALITEQVPVVVVAPRSATYDKILSNIQEVKARGARVLALATEGDKEMAKQVEFVMTIPDCDEWVMPIPAAVPLQLLAYYIAKDRGCNVDQPRNLAKSVTVE